MKGLAVAVILLFIGMSVVPSTAVQEFKEKSSPVSFDGNTLYVGGTGEGNYTKIQDAIDDAVDGDTVFVFDDSAPYYENVAVDKTIDLIGENRENTIIDGGGSGDVVYITADRVNISGFTIQNSGSEWGAIDAGVSISSNYGNVSVNNIINNNFGINLENNSYSNNIMRNDIINNKACGIYTIGSIDNTIAENDISDQWNGDGISLSFYSNGNIVIENNITNNCFNGIWLDFHSSDNTITRNTIKNNNWGIDIGWYANNNIISANNIVDNNFFGIQIGYFSDGNIITGNKIINNNEYGIQIVQINPLRFPGANTGNHTITENTIEKNLWGLEIRFSYGNTVTHNNIIDNEEFGINIYGSTDNIITNNSISNNIDGICLYYSINNSIIGNTIKYNDDYGINITSSSDNNYIDHNNFINNTMNAHDDCTNIWNDTYPSGGNYWSDYNGTDLNGDGIGDTPYDIPGGNNQDLYPLTHPWDGLPPEITNVAMTTSDPLDTEPGFGWENFTCTVTDNTAVDEVKLVLIGDTATEYHMFNDGNDYYCNITISTVGEYTYHIWADDTSDNEYMSAPQPLFAVSMNEDVNEDGSVGFVDIMMVAGMWNVEGPNGWDRADVDNSGEVGFVDVMMVAGMWGQEW